MTDMQIETPDGEIVTQPGGQPAPPEPEVVEEEAADTTIEEAATGQPGERIERKASGILQDLKDERKERRALSEENARIRAELDVAKRNSADIDTLRAQVEALKPKAPVLPDVTDDEAEATARRYGLYNVDATPDLKAGRAIQADIKAQVRATASDLVRAEVEPIRTRTLNDKAEVMVERMLARVAAEKRCTPETYNGFISQMTPEQRANQDVLNLALLAAEGIDARNGKAPSKAAPAARVELAEPLHTEASGGRRLPAGPLSAVEQKGAKITGMTSEQWKEHTKDFEPGKSFQLEK